MASIVVAAGPLGAGPAAAGAQGAAATAGEPSASAASKAKRNRFVARMERGIRRCANSRRERAGVEPLDVGLRLGRAARFHAQSMAKGGFFSHVDRRGRTPRRRVAMFAGAGTFPASAENIAAGQRGPRSACRAWMRSAGHRGSILNPRYTHIGGGFALGGPYRRYYVMELGAIAGS